MKFGPLPPRAAVGGVAAHAIRVEGFVLKKGTVVSEADASLPFLVGRDAEHAFLETARETYELSLQRAAESAGAVDADWAVRTGDVVESLAELTEVDVLFCGSRGYGPTRRVLLGGVSGRLVRRARRPVVVVPRSG